jgi:hypothetical protein
MQKMTPPRVRSIGLALVVFVCLASVMSLVVPVPLLPLSIATNRLLIFMACLGFLLAS